MNYLRKYVDDKKNIYIISHLISIVRGTRPVIPTNNFMAKEIHNIIKYMR